MRLGATFAVWATFGAVASILVWRIYAIDLPYPFGDEYMLQDVLTGQQPLTWDWLWLPIYVHRSTLVKALMVAYTALTHMNLKAVAWAMGLLYIAVASFMLYTVRKTRGSHRYSDAILPLAMLSCLQLPNIIAFLQLQFIIPYAFLTAFFCCCWQYQPRVRSRLPLLAAASIIVTPHCSAYGLCVAAGCLLWLVWYLAIPCDMLHTKRGRRILIGIAVAGFVYLMMTVPWDVVFSQIESVTPKMHRHRYGKPLTLPGRLLNGLTFLSLWTGVTVAKNAAVWMGPLVIAGLGAFSWVLGRQYRRNPEARFKVSAFFVVLIVSLLSSLMIAVGKDSGWYPRYYTLITPLVYAVYVALDLLPVQRSVKLAHGLALALIVSFTWGSYQDAMTLYRERQWAYSDLMAWIRAGNDPTILTPTSFPGLSVLLFPSKEVYGATVAKVSSAHLAVFNEIDVLFTFYNSVSLEAWRRFPPTMQSRRVGPHREAMLILPCVSSTVATSPSFELTHSMIQFRIQAVGHLPKNVAPTVSVELIDVHSQETLETLERRATLSPEPVSIPTSAPGKLVQLRFTTKPCPNVQIAISTITLSDLPLSYATLGH